MPASIAKRILPIAYTVTSTALPTRPVDGAAAATLELCPSTSLIDGAWLRPCRCSADDDAACEGCGLAEIPEMAMARIPVARFQ
jgi:hypothetical protein